MARLIHCYFYLLNNIIAGHDFIDVREVLQMTSGEKKCWNITILDDSISENDVEVFFVALQPTQYFSGRSVVYITDNDGGTYYCVV